MARFRFERNPRFTAEIQQTPEFKRGLAVMATGLAESIRMAAEPFRGTGYFIRHVEPRGGRVLLRDPFAHLAEFGSVNNSPQRNALRGARAAGLRFEDDREALS